ncbi:MAG: obgE [Solirubrobacterales bacterium]|jgi:GTP-binding protein|nr:obgE [Solirubrobacterales bacterium]
MLYDKARIFVQAGGGGNGCMSFRREAHVPMGGPDGGDGGRGADVVLVCDDSLRDLQSFKRSAHYKAGRGRHGEGNQRHGADGETMEVRVPPGTEVHKWDGTVYDLVRPGQRVQIAGGGSGGRGNRKFKSSTRQSPRFAEKGLEGDEGWIDLRLKLLADVGLVGVPNAGKSSLISVVTRAAPKIANYPFTTLEPVLGTLDGGDRQLILADIPGLIEGASDGAGLGHEFLAHVERTRLLVHVLELAPMDGSDPIENYETIERELEKHDKRLARLPRVLVLSKADLVPADVVEDAREYWQEHFDALAPPVEAWDTPNPLDRVPVIVTSSATKVGLEELRTELLRRVPLQSVEVLEELAGEGELAEHRVFKPATGKGWRVEQLEEGLFRVSGEQVERLLARHDLENEEALAHVEHRLNKMGIVRALEAEGFESGDDVEIAGIVFELN